MSRLDEIEARAAAKYDAWTASTNSPRCATHEDYAYDKSKNEYWDIKANQLISAEAVDASIPMEMWRVNAPPTEDGEDEEGEGKRKRGRPRKTEGKLVQPSADIKRYERAQIVEGSTWCPGEPKIICDYRITHEGKEYEPGWRLFNLYEPPTFDDPAGDLDASPWIDHLRALWSEAEVEHMLDYFAHMVQRPGEKCNHALILSGGQGIGKDAALDPIKKAVGGMNASNIDPDLLFMQYRPWLQSVLLVVDEARPHKDDHRATTMYNVMKPLIAAPPMSLQMDEKYMKPRYVLNVMRVVMTTNDWSGLYIPAEDRRMMILHSRAAPRWAPEGYFKRLFEWYESGGDAHVSAFLARRDISAFNPRMDAPRTALHDVLTGGSVTDAEANSEVAASLERLDWPDGLFAAELLNAEWENYRDMSKAMRNAISFRTQLQRANYIPIPPQDGGQRFYYKLRGKPYTSRLFLVKASIFNSMDSSAVGALIKARTTELSGETGPRLTIVSGSEPPKSRSDAENF